MLIFSTTYKKSTNMVKKERIFLHGQNLVQNVVEKAVSIKGGQDRK